MEVAKVFSQGDTQFVALPKDFRFNEEEILVNKVGDAVILLPKEKSLAGMLAELDLFTEDFMNDEKELPNNVRDMS